MGPVVRVLTRTVRWRLALIGAGLAASVGVVGCSLFPTDASPPPTDSTVRIDTRWVVGEAAAAVGPDGLFNFDSPLPPVEGELSRDEAVELARGAIRHLAVSLGGGREAIIQEHGAPIDFHELSPCPRRVIPVFSNLSDPGLAVPEYVRTPLGPYYLIEFCTAQLRPAVVIWLYVRTPVRVGPDGRLVYPNPSGNAFVPTGIPLKPLADLTPEYGARLVFQRVGIPITAVPEVDGCQLIIAICLGVTGRHWKFVLQRPVRVRLGSGTILETSVLYTQAGFGALDTGTVYVAAEQQPKPAWRSWTISATPDKPFSRDSVLLHVVRPLRLERFELLP